MQTPDEIKKGLSCGEKMDKDDAISREYCLDTIAKLPINWEYGLGVEDCYKIVENAPSIDGQVRKWISVEDRLPEDDDDVLIFSNERVIFVGCYKNGQWISYSLYAIYGNVVTHWMPLPSTEGLK